MTPQEYAIDFVEKLKQINRKYVLYGQANEGDINDEAKECALIAIDEILKGTHLIRTPLSFWQKVRNEIENY